MTAALAGRAGAIAGETHVISDPQSVEAYAVDGIRPAAVARPGTPEETAALLVAAGEDRAGVLPWGGGAHQHLGGIPTRGDLVVDTARLRGVTDYTPEDYVVAVRAGTPFRDLQATLAEHGQWLPLDPPGAREATIGGLIAANRNGPRRLLWGSIRDLLIGIRVALPTGEVIKAGGKVVKNVAGYDLTKLFIGSLGSVGIITEATFKISPRPGEGLTIRVSVPDLAAAVDLARAVMRSFLLPSALEVANPPAFRRLAAAAGLEDPPPGAWGVVLLVEGLEESRNRHVEEMRTIAGTHGRMEVLRGPVHEAMWQAVAEFPSPATHPGGVVCRAGGPIARWPGLTAALGALQPAHGAVEVLAHAGVGLFYAACAAPDGYMVVEALGRGAAETGGYAVVEVAPTNMKASLPLWGAPPGGLDLMRRLRAQFDPRGVMIPGRLGWGL
jgi:glycolate oxidase FAD binding subunit